MKTSWPTKKLKEACDVVTGSTPKTSVSEYYGGDYLWARPGDLNEGIVKETEKKLSEVGFKEGGVRAVPKGSVMMCCIGSIGKLGIASEEMATNQQINSFVPNTKKIDPMFLFYALNLYRDKFVSGSSSTTLKIINKTRCENIEIPLPPLEVQKKIVAKLEGLLAKVSEAKKLRAEARESADNLLSAELHKIFEEGKNKGWEEKELGEICELNPKKSEIKDEPDTLSVSFVPMAAVDEYSQTITALETRKLGKVKKGYTYFRDGDVLFAKITPCMENGKVAIAHNLANGIGFGTTEFHVIRPKKEVLAEWAYSIVRQQGFRDMAKEKMTGSAGQKRVPVRFLESYRIPVPSISEQKKIVARLDSISQKIEAVKELQNTTENEFNVLESSVLSKAFSGSLTF